jgi:hypothetical protein
VTTLFSGLLTTTNATGVFIAASTTTIAHGTLCNTTGSPVTVSIALVPAGGFVDGTHNVVSGYTLAANDTLSMRDYLTGAVLGLGDEIWITAGTANAITGVITGWTR